MKTVSIDDDPSAKDSKSAQRLLEIQQQMNDVCEPRYHEYHRPVTEHGFVKITLPRKKQDTAF